MAYITLSIDIVLNCEIRPHQATSPIHDLFLQIKFTC